MMARVQYVGVVQIKWPLTQSWCVEHYDHQSNSMFIHRVILGNEKSRKSFERLRTKPSSMALELFVGRNLWVKRWLNY